MVVVAEDMGRELPVEARVCKSVHQRVSSARQSEASLIHTGIPGHHARGDNDGVCTLDRAMRVVRRLNRAREKLVWRGVLSCRGDRRRLKPAVKRVAECQCAARRCTLCRYLLAKCAVGEVKLLSEALEQLGVRLFSLVQ